MRPGEKIPPLLPAAEALHQKRMANFMADRPSAHCLPHSIPDKMLIRIPLKIVQTSGLTLILYEQFTQYRQIFTDGRPHPSVGNPAWFGFSIGKWEGDWFVVDTRGFNDKSWIDDSGRPHTEALHTIERFGATSVTWTSKSRLTIPKPIPSLGRSRCNMNFSPTPK